MNPPSDSALHYPHGDTLPEPGTTLEVAPGVRWLRMPLPFALNHINLWLLRDWEDGPEGRREGWTIVDCGIGNDSTRALWERLFATELQGLPVLRVVVTHMHPDHIGLAHWLTERWTTPGRECRLWVSATDWNVARLLSGSNHGLGGAGPADFFARHGLTDPDKQAQLRARVSYYSDLVPSVPGKYRRLMDGMVLRIAGRDWHCIAGYGHAPEHIALHCPSLSTLISGDMVLPRISTNVSVIDLEPEGNPLPMYLASIASMRRLPEGTLVLPSHGKPFTGLHTRIAQLAAHHGERYAEVLQACAERPHSAAELLDLLFKRPLDLHQTTFAMGEAVAHLHALESDGRLRAEARGADGVQRFSTVG